MSDQDSVSKIKCEDCGFLDVTETEERCYLSKESVDPTTPRQCQTFFARQYDGAEPYTPTQHEWLFNDIVQKKQMKNNIQGLHL